MIHSKNNPEVCSSKAAYACWLDRIPTIGAVSARRLLDEYGGAEQVYRLPQKETEALLERGLLTAAQTAKLREWQTAERYSPRRLCEEMERQGIWAVCDEDDRYPQRLRTIPDPPRVLYVKGELPDEEKPCVSMVGARLCSDYGRYAARKFAYVLAGAGVQIISGMALGIDGISHKAAMEAGGRTFAVLGCGADICYPEQNRELYDRIQTQGGIISEYPPKTAPRAGLFPLRNRIISGLADLVLVIEARKKSGTLITVDAALEQGKEVYALPGRVTDALSGGCNRLIAQGAGTAVSPEELLEALHALWGGRIAFDAENTGAEGSAARGKKTSGAERLRDKKTSETDRTQGISDRTEAERLLCSLLSEEGRTMDELMQKSALAPGALTEALMGLCIRGTAVCRQGRYYSGEAG